MQIQCQQTEAAGLLSSKAPQLQLHAKASAETPARDVKSQQTSQKKTRGRKKKRVEETLTHDLSALAFAQLLDDAVMRTGIDEHFKEMEQIGEEMNYSRKRSLKFREKMRKWRTQTFGDAFHKQDRSVKSLNKQLAAKRRKRDDTGKFNLEARKSVAFIAKSDETEFEQCDLGGLEDECSVAPLILAIDGSNKDQETWHGDDADKCCESEPVLYQSLNASTPLFFMNDRIDRAEESLNCNWTGEQTPARIQVVLSPLAKLSNYDVFSWDNLMRANMD